MNKRLLLLSADEVRRRLLRVGTVVPTLISDNANLFYLTGRVFSGYACLSANGGIRFFVKRPSMLEGDDVIYIRKPEDIAAYIPPTDVIGLELGSLAYNDAMRLKATVGASEVVDVSVRMMAARSVKTAEEIACMESDGLKHAEIYRHIPGLFNEGMTDVELQIEIERLSRLHGCLGLFRVNGPSMELYMGNVLTGDNADAPSPYDFAMGGAGMHPSIPVGACGEQIRAGKTVMVDMNGNFNGYMTDMTRVYSCGKLESIAVKAHQCSIEICRALADMAVPGTETRLLYEKAYGIAENAGLSEYFMGHRYHAGFVGHGVGIQVNELPVLAPRSRSVIEEGNVIAIEPKFVIPGTGAVGIENTYVACKSGLRCITNAPEEIISLI